MLDFMTKMSVSIEKKDDGLYHCQNILAGMMGQEHKHDKKDMIRYIKENASKTTLYATKKIFEDLAPELKIEKDDMCFGLSYHTV